MKQTIGNPQQITARARYAKFKEARDAFKARLDGLDEPTLQAALNGVTSWDFTAASPTVNRENILFVGLAFLYVIVGALAVRVLKD